MVFLETSGSSRKCEKRDHMRKRQYNTEIGKTALESIEETALESTPISDTQAFPILRNLMNLGN